MSLDAYDLEHRSIAVRAYRQARIRRALGEAGQLGSG